MARTNGKPLSGVRALRRRAGLNQHDFWKRIGVTQSGGSRYENGRRVPKPVRILLDIAYASRAVFSDTLTKLRSGE